MSELTYLQPGNEGEAARMAQRRDQDTAVLQRSARGSWLPPAAIAGRRKACDAAFPSDARNRRPMSRVANPGSEPDLANHVSIGFGRHRDPRDLQQEDFIDTETSNRCLPEKAATVRSRSEAMKRAKRARLEAAGWTVGTADQLLGLSKHESEYVELKLALAEGIRLRRRLRRLTQNQLAKLVGSSQSRIAKMEAADPTVALDLMVRSFFATGVGRRELAGIIQRRARSTAA